MVDVSIIVAIYNADWEKLKMTIDSIVAQENVEFEVIFADDGSEIKWNEKIVLYLEERCKYSFADSLKNHGTVSNILNGVNKAKGKYIKVISPGDCINGKLSIKYWVDFMEKTNADMSFCNAIYYQIDGYGKFVVLEKPAAPKNVFVYHQKNKRKKLFVDYLLANDSILGASVMVRRDIFRTYLKEIEGKVKYAEDYIIRLMVFDNKKIVHLNECFLIYEYGDGISTIQSKKWAELLYKDFEATNEIIKTRNLLNEPIQIKYQKLLNKKKYNLIPNKIKKVIMFPTTLLYRFKMKYFFQKTPVNINDCYKEL